MKSLAMMKSPIAKNVEAGSVCVEVSGPFRNELHSEQVYAVLLRMKKIDNLESPFYIMAEVMARVVEMYKARFTLFGGFDFEWIKTLEDLPLVSPTNANQYKKTQRGNAIKAVSFHICFKKSTTAKEAKDEIQNIFTNVLAQLFSKNDIASGAGRWVMAILETNKPELYEWIVKVKGKNSATVATSMITKEINAYFGLPFEFKFNVKLESFMAKYDIVQFLKNACHMESWDMVSDYNMRHIFRDYPNMNVKLWAFEDVRRPTLYGAN